MNFGKINRSECLTNPPEGDISVPSGDCSNPAWRLAHPELCAQRLLIKPGVVVGCVGKSIRLGAFLSLDTPLQETDVSANAVFSTSDETVATVSASSGMLNLVGPGIVTISVSYQGETAQCDVTVFAVPEESTDCCATLSVDTVLLVDVTKSMASPFSTSYATRLAFAKAAIIRLINELEGAKDKMGLIIFNAAAVTRLTALTAVKATVLAKVPDVAQTKQLTSLYDGMAEAIDDLLAGDGTQKVLVLVSDGEDNHATFSEDANPATLAKTFKDAGGIVISLAVRASTNGYRLMREIATDGYFLNAYGSNAAAVLEIVAGLKGYYCDGKLQAIAEVENPTPELDYAGFINWDVIAGHVDLFGSTAGGTLYDYLPGNGLYVGLTGIDSSETGSLRSKVDFSIVEGSEYRLTLNLAGNQQSGASSVNVRVYSPESDGSITIHLEQVFTVDAAQGLTDFSATFKAPFDCDVKITITQITGPVRLGFAPGVTAALLNSVKLESITDASVLLADDFEAENPLTPAAGTERIIPAVPPEAQRDDPNHLPDTEQGATPPRTYTSTKPSCVACDAGNLSVSIASIIPAVTGYVSAAGTASASLEFIIEGEAASPPPSPAWGAFANPTVNVIGGVPPLTEPWRAFRSLTVAGANAGSGVNGTYAYVGDANGKPMFKQVGGNGYISWNNVNWSMSRFDLDYYFADSLLGDWSGGDTGYAPPNPTVVYVAFDPIWLKFVLATGKTALDYEITAAENAAYAPKAFIFQGSNDGAAWTDLDTRSDVAWFSYQTKRFRLSAPAAYTSYRLLVSATTAAFTSLQVQQLSLFEASAVRVCKNATEQSEISQADADQLAVSAAEALARAELHCRPVFTKTELYEAHCLVGEIAIGVSSITKSATRTSFNSLEEAKADALADATAAAVAALNCGGSNNDHQIVVALPIIAGDHRAGSPYPSVKHVAAVSGVIAKVTCTVRSLPFSYFGAPYVDLHASYSLLLQSPTGTIVELTRQITPNLYAVPTGTARLSFTFDDAAADYIRRITSASNIDVGDTYSVPDSPSAEYTFAVKPSQARASGYIAENEAVPIADGDTSVVNGKTYTYKNALTPTEGQVKIGANNKATLKNLGRAINHTGTPGTDYSCAAVHPTVMADPSNYGIEDVNKSNAVLLHAKAAGTGGNALTLAVTGTSLSRSAATLLGGVAVNVLPTPAPQVTGDYKQTLAQFIGENPNGNWKLWAAVIADDTVLLAEARVCDGWDLTITAA